MDTTRFHPDFREFLQLLNSNEVKYLLVGGYAVGVHGYPRRMGLPPVRIEILTGISGVDFAECYSRRKTVEIDGVLVNFISLSDLKINKKAAGRHKDLEDLDHLS